MRNNFEPKNNLILVAYDFTAEAVCALNHSNSLAKTTQSTIELVHIITKESKEKYKGNATSPSVGIQQDLEEIATQNTKENGIQTSVNAVQGDIFTTIGEIAEQKKAWYLVFGTHGVKGMQHILGAFALKLVSSSPCPVVIVQSKGIADHGYKNILLPIDGSKTSKQKVYQAIALSKLYDCKIHLFADRNKDEYIAKNINANVGFVKNKLEEHGMEISEESEFDMSSKDSFAKQSLKYASKNNIDLILLITAEEKGLVGSIMGVEDTKIINNESMIPVMCINPTNAMILGRIISFGGFV